MTRRYIRPLIKHCGAYLLCLHRCLSLFVSTTISWGILTLVSSCTNSHLSVCLSVRAAVEDWDEILTHTDDKKKLDALIDGMVTMATWAPLFSPRSLNLRDMAPIDPQESAFRREPFQILGLKGSCPYEKGWFKTLGYQTLIAKLPVKPLLQTCIGKL